MRKAFLVSVVAAAILAAILQPVSASAASSKTLLWRQEFNGKSGTKPDSKFWGYDLGNLNANSEEQYYTNSKYNVALDGKGRLLITARKIVEGSALWEKCISCKFSSARIKTQGKLGFKYGRIEARIKMPSGVGTWPAFWLLGANLDTVGWPNSGEIDIVEARGSDPIIAFGTAHGPGYNGSEGTQYGSTAYANAPLSDGYHVYAVEWMRNSISWYFDNQLYLRMTPSSVAPREYVFNREFFLILNLAMGGTFAGDLDPNLAGAQMAVDYIRYYKINGQGALIRR